MQEVPGYLYFISVYSHRVEMEMFVDVNVFFSFPKSVAIYFAAELPCALRLKTVRAGLHRFFPFFAPADPQV